MGNRSSSQVGRSNIEISRNNNHKKSIKKQQKQRRIQSKQTKVRKLRNPNKHNSRRNAKQNKDKAISYTVLSNHSNHSNHSNYSNHNSRNIAIRPRTPILAPKIEENVSDIEDPGDTNDENDCTPTLNQYLSRNKIHGGTETSPTTDTTASIYDRSFGMDSFDSISPQKQIVIDTTHMERHSDAADNHAHQRSSINQHDKAQEKIANKLSSPLFSIQESGDAAKKINAKVTAKTITATTPATPTTTATTPRVFMDLDDDDAFSQASTQPDETQQDNHTPIGTTHDATDNNSHDGSESLLSTGTSTEFDNISKGLHSNTEFDDNSKGVRSISDMSFSSIPSFIMNNKRKQKAKKSNTHIHKKASSPSSSSSVVSFRSSVSATPSFYSHGSISCNAGSDSRSIHTRRKISMKRARSENNQTQSRRPNASNAFETLPSHFIKTGLIRQTSTTLRDERFVKRRIEKLNPVYASKIHVSDFELLQKREKRDREKREKERDASGGGGLEAELPSASTFPEGDDYFSVMMDSFDLFLKLIMEMCDVAMNQNIFEIEEGCEELLDESDDDEEEDIDGHEEEEEGKDILQKEREDEDEEQIEEQEPTQQLEREEEREKAKEFKNVKPIDKPEPKVSVIDGGTAILTLGKFLQEKGWIDDAMYFFRHALHLFLLEVDVNEPSLLDEAEDCDGLFYADVAAEGSQIMSPVHELIGTILIKMGDVHGKNLEINDAMRAYRASQVFWGAYLANHKASIQEQGKDNVEDINLLNDYAAAVEGLALAHNRIGGVYTSKGDLTAALESFDEALVLQIDALGDDHLEVGKTLHNIGVCHRHDDQWDEALKCYEKAFIIFQKQLGKTHLDTARTLHNIGGVYRRKRMYHEAMECFREVLRIRRKLLGDDHPSVSITLVSIAAVLRQSGRKEEANKFYAAAIR